MVLKSMYHGRSLKKPYHTNVVKKVTKIVFPKHYLESGTLLKKRTALTSKCCHKNRFFLVNFKNNCGYMVFNNLAKFIYKDTDQKDIFCAAAFYSGLEQVVTYHFSH